MPANQSKKYVKGYEVHGVSPLPHYFEEIYGHTIGIPKIGPRGDKYYFWYSKNKNGSAYYEVTEQVKSAASTYKFLTDASNRKSYLGAVNRTITEIKKWIRFVEKLDIDKLTLDQLFKLNHRSWLLDAKIFSYYLISQPYRLQMFEDKLRHELKKRVAGSRIDMYLAKLTASEKMTQTASEELGWCQLQLKAKSKISGSLTLQLLSSRYSDIEQLILSHYEKYKVLSLGDGNWEFDSSREIKRFLQDYKKPTKYFQRQIKQIKAFPKNTLQERQKLIKQLNLPNETVTIINFMSEMSHIRYGMRVEGFIPLIYASDKLVDALAYGLGFNHYGDYPFMTYKELLLSEKRGEAVVSVKEIRRRRGKNDEFMLYLDNGKLKIYYGKEAGRMFKKLVPPIQHSKSAEVRGVSAEPGIVEGRVTVYQWGDNMAQTLNSIKKNPILIAGQTRPAMMPIIREAKGIVTDEGGVTSHAAIVARELRIPAVINTINGTKVFKTGDKVRLDANLGLVRKVK